MSDSTIPNENLHLATRLWRIFLATINHLGFRDMGFPISTLQRHVTSSDECDQRHRSADPIAVHPRTRETRVPAPVASTAGCAIHTVLHSGRAASLRLWI